jgi:hypothetical protein
MESAFIAYNLAPTDAFKQDKAFATLYKTIKSAPSYSDQMSRFQTSLQQEMELRPYYLKAIQNEDSSWWKQEIAALDKKITTSGDWFESCLYQRIRGFLGIVCYSWCQQAAQQRDEKMLDQVVSVYQLLEPENPEMLYFNSLRHKK